MFGLEWVLKICLENWTLKPAVLLRIECTHVFKT
jgi:hypothetical protein